LWEVQNLQIIISRDTERAPFLKALHDLIGKSAIADKVTEVPDGSDPARAGMGQDGLQRVQVGVNVSEQSHM
jgi:hypothetical protein